MPMSDRFDLNDLLFLHKVVYKQIPVELPSYLSFFQGNSRLRSTHLDYLSLVSSISPNIIPNLQNVTNKRPSMNPLLNSFFYRVHCKWNILPLALRKLECHHLFKLKLTEHLWKELSRDPDSTLEND